MNISTAANYLKNGLRISRKVWNSDYYLKLGPIMGYIYRMHKQQDNYVKNDKLKYEQHKRYHGWQWEPDINDLLADDYEIVQIDFESERYS